MIEIKRALISVSDKSGVVEFAKFLAERGAEILSTGGTLAKLKEAGIAAVAVEDYTGFPEMMDGRVKTLHPKIHGGLLALRDNPEHSSAMDAHGIRGIDLVVVNLYPFAQVVTKPGVQFGDAIENIDIGGPSMLRAAAKNYRFCAAVCNPARYADIQTAITDKGGITDELALALSREVFEHTASYDAMISGYLAEQAGEKFPDTLTLSFKKAQPLRYGENPHQAAAFYRPVLDVAAGRESARQLQGKELSFNNMLDFSSALGAALDLPGRGVVIIKHLNPCGAARAESEADLSEAFKRARSCDPVSAFGGVIAVNGPVDQELAGLITENFVEGVIALDFTDGAREIFAGKKNVRLLHVLEPDAYLAAAMEVRPVSEGILYEDKDSGRVLPADWQLVTKVKPDEAQTKALDFAWRLVKHVKSNAIVFCSDQMSLGIGAGQMSRVDSVYIAVEKAKRAGLSLDGSAVASDAFFPFRDGVDGLAAAGAKAVIQPGGSVRDEEVIAACDEHGIAMVFTGMRHFRH